MENPLYCDVCNCSFTRKYFLTQHLKSQKHQKRSSSTTSIFHCDCGNTYLSKKSLELHKKKCKNVSTPNITKDHVNVNVKINEMEQKLKDYEREKEEMKAQISMLLDNQASNTTNNTTNNTNIETQNNNITININAFGNENTDYIDDKVILQCIDRVYKSIPDLIQKIHFDPQHPENHNIKITNKKLPYASVMGTNQKWKTIARKEAIDKMVNNGYFILDEKYEVNKGNFDPRKQKNFEGFKYKFETEEKNTMKMIKGDVEIMVMNGGI
jgi:hypothetical protein